MITYCWYLLLRSSVFGGKYRKKIVNTCIANILRRNTLHECNFRLIRNVGRVTQHWKNSNFFRYLRVRSIIFHVIHFKCVLLYSLSSKTYEWTPKPLKSEHLCLNYRHIRFLVAAILNRPFWREIFEPQVGSRYFLIHHAQIHLCANFHAFIRKCTIHMP